MRLFKILIIILFGTSFYGCEEKYNKFLSEQEPSKIEQVDELQQRIEELKENPDNLTDEEIQQEIDEIKDEIDRLTEEAKDQVGETIPDTPDDSTSSTGGSSSDGSTDPDNSSSSSSGGITVEDLEQGNEELKDALDELADELMGNIDPEEEEVLSEEELEEFCSEPVDNTGSVPPSFGAYEKCM
jgi:DNA repair exonuclease SbcCD ATPase subunit